MHFGHILFFIFVVVPLIEIYLLITVGGIIGLWPTIGLIILTAVTGTWLLRLQGTATVNKLQHEMAAGHMPAMTLMEGIVLIVAGALLLTPGFFTDAVGFACLLPGIRQSVARWLGKRLASRIQVVRPRPRRPTVFEGDFKREE